MTDASNNNRLTGIAAVSAPLLVCVSVALFAVLTFRASPAVEEIDYGSAVFEGILALLPAIGLFFISGLRKDHPRSFWMLFLGMSALTLALTTDTLDEFVEMPDSYNFVFEGLFQVVGFGLLIFGLRSWLQWNDALNLKLNELATTDYLTGAANRREFMTVLENQIRLAQRYEQALSLVLIDLDHFKAINDEYGHDTGDQELTKVSDIARHSIRRSDCFARYGGEEFVLLAPSTDIRGAQAIAENIRHAIESSKDPRLPKVTASFGVAQSKTNETRNAFIKRADQALYEAKHQGRNRVVAAH